FDCLRMRYAFDRYPKGMIRNVKNWEWFLEEPSK
ncbi:VID27-like protein, partial [Trifolium medium]|nr:VID27-like protein [Trifolium medium]